MKSWITNRIAWMTAQFVAAPVPSDPGGTLSAASALTFTVPAGEVYFTLDGSDPRISGGAVSSSAKPYATPIPINRSVTIMARTRKENRWSNPVTVRFVSLRPAEPAGG
jgi:hypothetical protein